MCKLSSVKPGLAAPVCWTEPGHPVPPCSSPRRLPPAVTSLAHSSPCSAGWVLRYHLGGPGGICLGKGAVKPDRGINFLSDKQTSFTPACPPCAPQAKPETHPHFSAQPLCQARMDSGISSHHVLPALLASGVPGRMGPGTPMPMVRLLNCIK